MRMVRTATQLEQTCMPETSGSKVECMLPPFALMSEVGWQEDGGFPISTMSYMAQNPWVLEPGRKSIKLY